MIRQFITFPCEGHMLHGTLDMAPEQAAGKQALLIVSGGNEVRSGAWNGQAQFAARIAAAGHPVLRYDRRGIGDSEGQNGGFRSCGPDIQAALAALRQHCPQVNHVVGLGNCDAASALMLGRGAGCDALVLSNPWTFDDTETAPQAQAVEVISEPPPQSAPMTPAVLRRHYLNRLTDPKAIWRLLTGKVNIGKLAGSLQEAAAPPPPPPGLFGEMADGISGFLGPIRFLVADRDRTGQVFASLWQKGDIRLHHCPGASHSFLEPFAQKWLEEQVLAVLRAQSGMTFD